MSEAEKPRPQPTSQMFPSYPGRILAIAASVSSKRRERKTGRRYQFIGWDKELFGGKRRTGEWMINRCQALPLAGTGNKKPRPARTGLMSG
jgi:hypothetical protein